MVHPQSRCQKFIHRLITLSRDLDLRPKHRHLHHSSSVNDHLSADMDVEDTSSYADTPADGILESADADTLGQQTEVFSTAAKVYGHGFSFMDIFHQSQHAEARSENVFYPFASKEDWELASWLVQANLSMDRMDNFFSLELVCMICLDSTMLLIIFRSKAFRFRSAPQKYLGVVWRFCPQDPNGIVNRG